MTNLPGTNQIVRGDLQQMGFSIFSRWQRRYIIRSFYGRQEQANHHQQRNRQQQQQQHQQKPNMEQLQR